MHSIGRQIESKSFDREKTVALGIVGPKHGAESAGTNLMENLERPEGSWRCRTWGVRVQ
jgi:hypothetical protein